MISFVPFLVLLPTAGFLISLLISGKRESVISRIAFSAVGLHMLAAMLFIGYWLISGHPILDEKDIVLFRSPGYEFFIDFYFDKVTATYLFTGSFLTFLVTLYSREYMHRENGYKRFFNTILCFYMGYNLVIFSGNLETLFMGWEILGVASFLLIAFYRERYLPVKNALKVFSVYRIGDVGLMLAMWASYHLWHENITFLKLGDYAMVHKHLQSHTMAGVFISLMILTAASAKSALLPFSSWLPRAMEGPTPSTAIFYGSLSVHLGVFLLLRTFSFWEHQLSVRILIGILGLSTAIITTGIARVQSSVNSQIAYASIAQIGLIFVEVAAGLHTLALFHFAGNAFLRTYQLLISPSVVSYLIREQFYNVTPASKAKMSTPNKLRTTFYILFIKELDMESILRRYLGRSIKMLGGKLRFLTFTPILIGSILIFLAGVFCSTHPEIIPTAVKSILPVLFSLAGLLMVIKSFTEHMKTRTSWAMVMMNHFFVILAVSFNEPVSLEQIYLYFSGIIVSGVAGYLILVRLKSSEESIGLDQFHGHSHKYPGMAAFFLLCCLGLSGFPITPTFIGEDIIFSHIHGNQIVLASITALSLMIDGLAIIRIYARVFLGPHVGSIHEMAYRSS